MRIMITGGGTGGHTSPAAAVIEELRRRDSRLLLQWVGNKHGIEAGVAQRCEVPFRPLAVEGWTRRKSPRLVWVLMKLAYSMMRAWFYLKIFQPQAVFGVGGYVSLPAVWMAQRMGIPTVLHEQNKRLGLANRLCAKRAACLLLGYPETEGDFPRERAQIVGNPVRAAFLHPPEQEDARRQLHLDARTPTIAVVGGSQGARTLNQAMTGLLQAFEKGEAQFIWATGKSAAIQARMAADGARCLVRAHAFIEDMAAACAAADIVVSRAGASTAAELALLGKPCVLVPYPHAADNHQEHNARAFERAGAAVVLLDDECTPERLEALLRELLAAPERLEKMGQASRSLAKPMAAEQIAEAIMTLTCGSDATPKP